jgi:hypothetical protein
MTTGFRTKNASGTLQIDQNYENLALRAKGTFTPGTPWNNSKWRLGSFTVTGNTPVIAWRASGPATLVSVSVSGTSVTYQFLIAAASGSIDWWLFDKPTYVAMATAPGIRIKNPSTGVVVFDSRMKYMRVVGVISGDYASLVAPAAASYAGTPAVVVGNVAYQYVSNIVSQAGQPPYPWVDFIFYPMASFSGQQITWSTQQSDAINHIPSETKTNASQQDSYNYLVIDVTGY